MFESVKSLLFKTVFAWLLVVLLFGLLLRVIFLNAPLQSDDTTYFAWASDLSTDLFINASFQAPFRIGLLIPLALVQEFFGYSLSAYYIYSVGSSLFLLTMVFLLGFRFSGLQTSLLSSLLFACSFFGLYQTTNLLPDVPNLAMLLSSFLVFTYINDIRGKNIFLIIFLSSFLAFSSYLIRAPNIVFLISIPVYEILTRKSLKSTFLFSIIFLCLWIGECYFYQVIANDFFLRARMIPKGTTLWAKYMPEISWQTYLKEPFTLLTHTFSGTLILWGGLAGTLIAIWKKNFGIIALLAGALLLFIVYSYSVTSVSPLRRALPLNTRYIIAFAAALTIATGYALSSIKPGIEKILSKNIAILVLSFIIVTLIGFQINELPRELPNTILFKDNSYFLADQILKSKNRISDLRGKVHAYPAKDFKMYPNFSRLELKGFTPADMTGGRYYLYSRQRVWKTLYYGYLGDDDEVVMQQNLLLLRNNPTWDYIINTTDIVLAYVPSFEQKRTEIMSLDGSYFSGYWGKPKEIIAQEVGGSAIFRFRQKEKPFYIFTFPGKFSLPPHDNIGIFNKLKPDEIYELRIQYRIQKKMQNLSISLSQYDKKKRIDSVSVNASSAPGAHVLKKLFVTSSSYKKFRLFFRVSNKQQENQLEIEKITFNLVSECR